MKLRDIYARPGLTFSIEFFPPKTPCRGLTDFGSPGICFSLNQSASAQAVCGTLAAKG